MRTLSIWFAGLAALGLAFCGTAWGQVSNTGSTGSMFGSTGSAFGASGSLGSGSMGSRSSSSRGMGNSGFGSGNSNDVGADFMIQRSDSQFVGSSTSNLPQIFGGMTGSGGAVNGARSNSFSSSRSGSLGSSSFGGMGNSSFGNRGSLSSSSYSGSRLGNTGSRTLSSGSYGSGSSVYGSSSRSSLYGGMSGLTGSRTGSMGGLGSSLGSMMGNRSRTGYGTSGTYGSTMGRSGYGGVGTRGAQAAVHIGLPDELANHVAPSEARTAAVTARLGQARPLAARSPVQATLSEGTVTLRGVVATEHDRALAEQLARLEPGVVEVKNELVLGSGPSPTSGSEWRASPPRSPAPAAVSSSTP